MNATTRDTSILKARETRRIKAAKARMAELAAVPGYSDALRGSPIAGTAAQDAVAESFDLYLSLPECAR